MLASIIYWAIILVCIAWTAVSLFFSIFYFSRKEFGNLWAFAFFNVMAMVVLAIALVIFRTWGFGVTQYSSLIYAILGAMGGLTVLQAILGREPKVKTA
ncbi:MULTISPECIES: hypothetical protein [Enterococcus]|uniref:Uncharacterized protein n=1 Tax=Enterococcus alcedinis TaxID=1274384 RepID=A0A917JHD7_9ENTE|nr:hypothetical protein [Enterococcus alcedinis]MBP2102533.1 hypothetical protein [Enterococcus alcedinis]GGI66092.1 hypothetical protein GCM10011482_17460 [Enterococcus alcedinis]